MTLLLEDNDHELVNISALSSPTICSPLTSRVDTSKYPHLQGLKLADHSRPHDSVDVLIGSDHYWNLVTNEIVRGEFGPTAINSRFGWLISGPTEYGPSPGMTVTNLISEPHEYSLVESLKQFWETESIGIKGEAESQGMTSMRNCVSPGSGMKYSYPGRKTIQQ